MFPSSQGLLSHQARSGPNNYGCRCLKILQQRDSARADKQQRIENVKRFRLRKNNVDVSMGPQVPGTPITSKEKHCILNLYQSYVDEEKSEVEAREEVQRRLQFSHSSVLNTIKEFLCEGNVFDNKHVRKMSNAHEKLAKDEKTKRVTYLQTYLVFKS